MHYANIKFCDIANGEGVRTSLFVSGCTHHCKNCFNEVAWDFNYGELFTDDTIKVILDSCEPAYIAGLTLLGGEPMELSSQEEIAKLVAEFKARFPKKNIWIYSGYLFEDFIEGGKMRTPFTDTIFQNADVLVDGEFVQEEYDISLKFRGSRNQRILDLSEYPTIKLKEELS